MTAPAKPTSGPWTCEPALSSDALFWVWDKDGNYLTEDEDEREKIARLIAAAPDLADALRQVLPFVEKELNVRIDSFTPPEGGYPPIEPDEQEVIDEAQAAVDVIRAALAKLEG